MSIDPNFALLCAAVIVVAFVIYRVVSWVSQRFSKIIFIAALIVAGAFGASYMGHEQGVEALASVAEKIKAGFEHLPENMPAGTSFGFVAD